MAAIIPHSARFFWPCVFSNEIAAVILYQGTVLPPADGAPFDGHALTGSTGLQQLNWTKKQLRGPQGSMTNNNKGQR